MADGSFDPSTTNSALHLRKAGQNPVLILNTIDQLFEDAKIPMSKRENVRVTLFAMATLHLVFADRRPLWKRAFKKALDWVCAQGLPSDQIDLWMKSLHAAA
jgi:hypothetical protein